MIIPDDGPGTIVTAEKWSSLWMATIEQGDYGQDTLEEILSELYLTAWHPTEAAASLSNPAIYPDGSLTVSGQLSELKSFADQIVADLNETAWHATDGAISINNPALYAAGSTTVKGQLTELKTHMDVAESDIDTQTGRIDDLYDGTVPAYNASRLGGASPAYYGTAAQITNLQGQIDGLAVGAISAFSHNDISNRDALDAHPQSAITGLVAELFMIDNHIGILGDTVLNLTHAGFTDRNNTASHTASAIEYDTGTSVAQKIANIDSTIAAITGDVSELAHNDLLGRSDEDAHPISAVTGLQTALDGKAAASHGTHVTYGTTAAALTSGGTGTAGTSDSVSRADHIHTLPAYPVVTLSSLGVTSTAAELNKLAGVTATTAQLNFVTGVTSAIQTQLNGKQKTISYGTANPSGGVDGDVYIKY